MPSVSLKLVSAAFLGMLGALAHGKDALTVGVGAGMQDVLRYSDGQLSGALAPVYSCVFEHARIEPKYLELPLKRGLRYLKSGQISALLPMARSPGRDEIGVFGGELFEANFAFVSLHPLLPHSQRHGLRYAIPRGFIGQDFINNHRADIHEVTQWAQAVAMLRYGRVDVAVIPENLIGYLFGPGVVNVHWQTAGRLPVSLYLSDATQEGVATRIQAAVEDCRLSELPHLGPADES